MLGRSSLHNRELHRSLSSEHAACRYVVDDGRSDYLVEPVKSRFAEEPLSLRLFSAFLLSFVLQKKVCGQMPTNLGSASRIMLKFC